MQTIITKIRDLIEDGLKYTSDTYEYISSKIFTLSEANIDATTLTCLRNGAVYAASNYTYSAVTGKVTVTGSLTAGDILEFGYSAYTKYSDAELRGYIRSAFTYLATEKYKIFIARSDVTIYPTPTESEEYLIALIVSILIQSSVRSYRTPEISVNFNEDVTREEKIKQTIRQFSKNLGTLDYMDLKDDSTLDENIEDEDC